MAHCLAQGYMQTKGARTPTMDLLTAGQPALPPEPQLLWGLNFYLLGVIPFTNNEANV